MRIEDGPFRSECCFCKASGVALRCTARSFSNIQSVGAIWQAEETFFDCPKASVVGGDLFASPCGHGPFCGRCRRHVEEVDMLVRRLSIYCKSSQEVVMEPVL